MQNNNGKKQPNTNDPKQPIRTNDNDKPLNWIEKFTIKRIIKQAQKKINKYKRKAEYNTSERLKIEQAILQIGQSFEIINENTNEELNSSTIKLIPQQELLTLFEQTINELKKEI